MRLQFNMLMALSFCVFFGNAQKVDNDTTVKMIKLEITNFFISRDLLKKDEVNGNLNSVFATELNEEKVLGYNINGIYRIGVFQSHTDQHVLIKENTTFKLFDVKRIDILLKELIEYSKRNSVTQEILCNYIKLIIGMYNDNYMQNTSGSNLRSSSPRCVSPAPAPAPLRNCDGAWDRTHNSV